MTRLLDIGEFGLIQREIRRLNQSLPATWVGAGDDCAVIPFAALPIGAESASLVFTVDTIIEGRHFRRDYSSFADIGWKLLAVNLSDIAAMGAVPTAVVLSLQLPADTSVSDIDDFYRGFSELAGIHKTFLVGGDTVQSSVLAFSATVIGTASKPICRDGAKAGEDIWVTGSIGGAGAGLLLAEGRSHEMLADAQVQQFSRSYQRPTPRLEVGQRLAHNGLATSMIDISDGLLQDASHIANMSGVILEIDVKELPVAAGLRQLGISALEAASFGDDYELLFTASETQRQQVSDAADGKRIGTVRNCRTGEQPDVVLLLESGAAASLSELIAEGRVLGGYKHFRKD